MRGARSAPSGKFLVLGVDTFAHEEYPLGTFETKDKAVAVATEKGGPMNCVYVYDDMGSCVFSAGSYA